MEERDSDDITSFTQNSDIVSVCLSVRSIRCLMCMDETELQVVSGFFLSSPFVLWAAGFCCCGRSRPSRRGHSAREACWRRAGRQTWPKVSLWTSCLNEGSVMLPDVEMSEDTCLAFFLLFWDPDEFVSCYGWDPDLWIFSFIVSKSYWTLGGCVFFPTRTLVNSCVSYWKTWYLPLFGFPVHPPAPLILLVSPQETHFSTCQTVRVGKPLLPFWTTSTCRSSLILIPAARFRLTQRLSHLYLRPHLVSCTAAFSLCRCGLDSELNLSCHLALFASLFCLWHSWLSCGCHVRPAASCVLLLSYFLTVWASVTCDNKWKVPFLRSDQWVWAVAWITCSFSEGSSCKNSSVSVLLLTLWLRWC